LIGFIRKYGAALYVSFIVLTVLGLKSLPGQNVPWQDIAIGLSNLGFIAALIPSITTNNKPNKHTSFMTSGLLMVCSYAMFTSGLVISSVSALVTSIGWAVLFLQKQFEQ